MTASPSTKPADAPAVAASRQQTSGFQVTIREIIVDVVAALLPGFVFVAATVPAVLLPIVALCAKLRGHNVGIEAVAFVSKIKEYADAFRWEIAVIAFVLSYVFGHLFYRQDPKVPDGRSVQRCGFDNDSAITPQVGYRRDMPHPSAYGPLRKAAPLLNRIGFVRALILKWKKGAGIDTDEVQFPYSNLYHYLRSRGFDYLADLVWWRPEDRLPTASTDAVVNCDPRDRRVKLARSKQFINLLKIRLEFDFPERCNTIARNEAHVRLMSSVWYCSRTLISTATAGLVCGAIANYPFALGTMRLELIVIPGLIVVVARLVQDRVESVFHYQRIREVFFVLESANWASRAGSKLLDDLRPTGGLIDTPLATSNRQAGTAPAGREGLGCGESPESRG